MEKSWILGSSIGRKVAMSLSALFLIVFLTQHLLINFSSVLSEDVFNSISHFMGTNPLVQGVLQPILLLGIVFHFVMGIYLELQNKKARGQAYVYKAGNVNADWASKNMIISGLVVLVFLLLHLYDFWLEEILGKYITKEYSFSDSTRYYTELAHKFEDPIRVAIYVVAFVLLGFHLNHGFQSAFQSVGLRNNKYTPGLKKVGTLFSILVPLGFILVAVYHYVKHI